MTLPSSATSLDDNVQLARIRIFFGHASGNMASILVGAILIAVVLYSGGVPLPTLGVWGLFVCAASAGVLLVERRVKKTGVTAGNCQRLVNLRIGLGAGIALSYGIVGFLLPGTAPAPDTFLFIIVSTVVTVAALGYAVMPRYYLTLNVVSLLPLTGHFAHQYLAHADSYYLLLIAVAIMWQAIVLAKARQVSATAIGAIVLNERLQQEIEENRRTKEAIRHMALHDDLTALGNRRYFDETIARTLSIACRDQGKVGLLAIDLDNFKPINDAHGHGVGDLLLQEAARRIAECVREVDTVARFGGDEFVVLLNELDQAADQSAGRACMVADKIRARLMQPYAIDFRSADGRDSHVEHQCTSSIGVILFKSYRDSEEDLLRNADIAMYQAKDEGRNRIRLYDPARQARDRNT